LGETTQLFWVLRGLWAFYLVRGALQTARELVEQVLNLAQRVQDPPLLVEAHWALGNTLLWQGEVVAAPAHLEPVMNFQNMGDFPTVFHAIAGACRTLSKLASSPLCSRKFRKMKKCITRSRAGDCPLRSPKVPCPCLPPWI